MTARLLLAYDGGGFSGWARQPGLRTVQGELERALATVLRTDVALTVAGRTDAGVHARGQVASHAGPTAPAQALNALLDPDVRVLESVAAPDGFDARRDAVSRSYRYRLWPHPVHDPFERGRSLHWPRPLDRAALDACAALLVGTHDFTAFTPAESDHVRFERDVLAARWEDSPAGSLDFRIEADTFMRHMVRVLVGTTLELAGSAGGPAELERLLTGRPRSEGGRTAPAHGLYLESVRYP